MDHKDGYCIHIFKAQYNGTFVSQGLLLTRHPNSTSCWMLSSITMFTMFVLEVFNVYMLVLEFGCIIIKDSIIYFLLLCDQLMCKSSTGGSTFTSCACVYSHIQKLNYNDKLWLETKG